MSRKESLEPTFEFLFHASFRCYWLPKQYIGSSKLIFMCCRKNFETNHFGESKAMKWNLVIFSCDAHIFWRLTLRLHNINFLQDRTSNHISSVKANVFVLQSTENFMKIAFWNFSMSGYNSSIMPIYTVQTIRNLVSMISMRCTEQP